MFGRLQPRVDVLGPDWRQHAVVPGCRNLRGRFSVMMANENRSSSPGLAARQCDHTQATSSVCGGSRRHSRMAFVLRCEKSDQRVNATDRVDPNHAVVENRLSELLPWACCACASWPCAVSTAADTVPPSVGSASSLAAASLSTLACLDSGPLDERRSNRLIYIQKIQVAKRH